jgi:fermentation-respiration switch protein FrsA (DUF1100 family)
MSARPPSLAGLSEDAQDLLAVLACGDTRTQRDIAYGLWGPGRDGTRRVQAATQELRLARWPVVTDDAGTHFGTDAAEVAACALALRRRAMRQMVTARALREAAQFMVEPRTLWEVAS